MPAPSPIPYPVINGHRHSYSSAEITIAGLRLAGIKAINYKHSLEPGQLRGNRASLIGRTRGEYSADGSIELYLPEYQLLIAQLVAVGGGRGFMEVEFIVNVAYEEPGLSLIQDDLIGVRLTSAETALAEGNEGLVKKCDLSIMELRENNRNAVAPKHFGRIVS